MTCLRQRAREGAERGGALEGSAGARGAKGARMQAHSEILPRSNRRCVQRARHYTIRGKTRRRRTVPGASGGAGTLPGTPEIAELRNKVPRIFEATIPGIPRE